MIRMQNERMRLIATLLRLLKKTGNGFSDAPPVVHLFRKLAPSCFGNLKELRLTIVFRDTPLGFDATLLLETNKRRIDRPLIQKKNILADLFDAPRDSP